jgi:threonyl-tRNA synthetase
VNCRPPGKRVGSDELWDRAEAALAAALDSAGRRMTCSRWCFLSEDRVLATLPCRVPVVPSLDFNLPVRLEPNMSPDKHRHPACCTMIPGSLNVCRNLIEHYEGASRWLVRPRGSDLNITDKQADFAAEEKTQRKDFVPSRLEK